MERGFKKGDLRPRYDVDRIDEDEWHTYEGERVLALMVKYLPDSNPLSVWLVNAGAGVYRIGLGKWREIAMDLFTTPIEGRQYAVCGNIERLPFQPHSLGAIVCVGEVLGYCDPAKVLAGFAQALVPSGYLIFDFSSSRSPRYWFREPYAKAANLVTDIYNGTPEKTWVYSPEYVEGILSTLGFSISSRTAINTWSSLAKRFQAGNSTALFIERKLKWLPPPATWADLMMIVAEASGISR